MGKLKQSFSWWCVAGQVQDVPRFLKEMRAVGYDGVEMLPREWWQAARDAGLTIATEIGHQSIPDGLNRRENHGRIRDELLAKIDLAAQFGIPNLICFSGNRGGLTDEEGALNTAEGLAAVARAAEQKGVTLVLELLNSKVDHVDYQCDRTSWGLLVCRMVNSPRVRLLYDIYHMQIMEGDILRTLTTRLDCIGHIHTAGNPGRHDLDDTQELNYRPIFRALADAGYRGFVGHEFLPKGEALAAFRQAYQLCDL
jgi:hydroxypyruvate isomerase